MYVVIHLLAGLRCRQNNIPIDLCFRLNYLLHGLHPLGFHLLNTALHVAVTCLVVRVAMTTVFRQTRPSLMSGILFAVHPVHTEAVSVPAF